jgi:transcriptional regulator of heat shock response
VQKLVKSTNDLTVTAVGVGTPQQTERVLAASSLLLNDANQVWSVFDTADGYRQFAGMSPSARPPELRVCLEQLNQIFTTFTRRKVRENSRGRPKTEKKIAELERKIARESEAPASESAQQMFNRKDRLRRAKKQLDEFRSILDGM